jgi:hypothetical protein
MIANYEKDLEIEEIFTEDCVKQSKHRHPTLKEVQRKMKGFDESLILYTYHKLNGREQEAETYLREWEEEQELLGQTFKKIQQNLISNDITEEKNE